MLMTMTTTTTTIMMTMRSGEVNGEVGTVENFALKFYWGTWGGVVGIAPRAAKLNEMHSGPVLARLIVVVTLRVVAAHGAFPPPTREAKV